ncbi:MAG: alpha/beta hydrolase fold domain-containing protein [Eubacteriales bacterium]|nr:alpha/beta hydrolase fold domain-containing protein [Eubacteriales bacterium]
MNKVMKLLLKLFSSSKLDVKKNYQAVRDFQDFLTPSPKQRDPIEDYYLPSLDPQRSIPIRIFFPSETWRPGAIIFFHGGGWVIGNIDTYTPICSHMAEVMGQVVFSVDYRLAPEYPFPAGLEDCLTAAHLLIDYYYSRELSDEGLVTLCGDSAGGNLAAVVSLLLRDAGMRPADRQILFYPATYGDYSTHSPFASLRTMGEDYGLTCKKIQDYMDLYLPDPSSRKRPEVSPLLAHSLQGLPATLILTAEYDPLRDEGESFALALQQAGNQAEVYRVLDAPHNYLAYPDWSGAIEESYARVLAFLGYHRTSIKDIGEDKEKAVSRKLSQEEIRERESWLEQISREKAPLEQTPFKVPLQNLRHQKFAQQKSGLDSALVQASQKRGWLDLDNASKIFPAAITDTDTKVFRFTATMQDEVDPLLLQEALDQAYEDFPLYHAVLRRGFFWYYFQDSNLTPRLRPEAEVPMRGLYQLDRKNLLFRVIYYHERIHLEVFHALSDGNGAADFFRLLLTHYVNLRYLADKEEAAIPPLLSAQAKEQAVALQSEDSYSLYFAKPQDRDKRKLWLAKKREIQAKAAALKVNWPQVHHLKGTLTPDHRTQILECDMPLTQILHLAKSQGVSLSVYLTALFIQSIYRAKVEAEPVKQDAPREPLSITISVPVNLRSFFPSQSSRNFFATITIGYGYEGTEPSFSELCQAVKDQYSLQVTKDNLAAKLYSFYEFEENLALRPILRPLKDLVLKLSAKLEDRKHTTALSNMGKLRLPEEISPFIKKVALAISARRPQFVCISYGDNFNLSFCSPYRETDIQRHFLRFLRSQGVDIMLAANNIVEERC